MPDVVIVGSGPCGSLVAAELTARGASVVVLEAGPRFDAAADLPNSEANAANILWTEPRVYAGPHGVVPKTGIGVGGGTLAWLGVMPRFHPADFSTHTHRRRRRRLADRLRRPASVLRAGRARIRRGRRVRAVRAGALHAADAAASHELARAGARARRAGARRASVRAAGGDQLGGVRRPARVLLLRLVRLGLRHRREGHRGQHLSRARRAARRDGDQRRVRASREVRRRSAIA